MPKFEDENGVLWDIKTTSVQIGTGTPVGKFVAAVDDDSPFDYSGSAHAQLDDDEAFDGFGGTTARLTWPAGGNPILRGPGDGVVTIKAFAAAEGHKKTRAVRVRASADPKGGGTGLLVLLGVAVLVWATSRRKR